MPELIAALVSITTGAVVFMYLYNKQAMAAMELHSDAWRHAVDAQYSAWQRVIEEQQLAAEQHKLSVAQVQALLTANTELTRHVTTGFTAHATALQRAVMVLRKDLTDAVEESVHDAYETHTCGDNSKDKDRDVQPFEPFERIITSDSRVQEALARGAIPASSR